MRRSKPRVTAPIENEDNEQLTAGPQRLQKVLAAAGIGSRRHCEELIATGRVEVDRQVVTELGTKVDPEEQLIRVDGQALPRTRKAYYVVHKPPGAVSTNHDPSGRPRVIDLLPPSEERLFAVGRLDMSSEGLMLLTNDGELANQLTHPRYGVEKTYHVLVAGTLEQADAAKLLKGVHLAEGFAKAARLRLKAHRGKSTQLEIVLTEGHNREIRRLLARVGHKVLRLKRVAIAGVRLADLPPSAHRRLTADELRNLRAAVQQARSGVARLRSDRKAPRPRPARMEGPRRPRRGLPR